MLLKIYQYIIIYFVLIIFSGFSARKPREASAKFRDLSFVIIISKNLFMGGHLWYRLLLFQLKKMMKIVGLSDCPTIIDLRIDEDFALDPRLIPGAIRHDFRQIVNWAPLYTNVPTIIYCQKGQKISQGSRAYLNQLGQQSEVLEGGWVNWIESDGLAINEAAIPARNTQGQSMWVTRSRPKIDRIACPWLIRRFIDPRAIFLYVDRAEVLNVADRFGATPFDVDGAHFSHHGLLCSFDAMLSAFGLDDAALNHLSNIVRAADTGKLDDVPQAAGFLAISLGFSRMSRDDNAQLDMCMPLYDALYRWCRDGVDEIHLEPSHTPSPKV